MLSFELFNHNIRRIFINVFRNALIYNIKRIIFLQ